MKILKSLIPTLVASSLVFTLTLTAFDNPPEATNPDLSLAFPFEQRGDEVVNTIGVLINPGCLIPAGTVFLTIFVPPRAEDADVKKKAQKNSQEDSYSRRVQLPDKKDSLSPEQQAAYDRATKAPWKNHMIYRAALKQYRFDEMRLVFVTPGSDKASLEAFNLPEGLFLGEEGRQIKVLAVQKESTGGRLGIVPGSILLKVNDHPLENLAQFQKLYFSEKKTFQDAGRPMELTVRPPGEEGTKTFAFAPPRKLDLNDFFSASDVAKDPDKKPTGNPEPDPNPVTPLAP